ncbi:MAG: acetylornithine deacetylase [Azospirillum sp.]|nr:acetylornithine deacetylase [Azospirillum sp.]MCZ8124664.1 acetylornithine deacetylase [Magnetospirillum sp.]
MSSQPSPESLDLVRTLVSFDTTSRDSNLALIDWVRGYLAKLGVDSHLVHDETGRKANLWATIGPADRPGLVLSGHTDVVPIDGQEWTVEPFKPSIKDGRIYGRGTTDMKSFLAVCLALAPEFKKAKLKRPIHFAFSYDEEVGCLGVRRLLDDLKTRGIKPAGCVVGEPTNMKVIRAHKGKLSLRAHVRGFECHSSLAPRGVNAVQYAARIVAKLADMNERFAADGPFDAEFDIPYTTAHVGTIQGGTALNIVPKDCKFDFEFRHLPVHDPRALFAELEAWVRKELEPKMRAVHADTGVRFEELSTFPGLSGDEDAEVTQAAKAASGGNATGKVAFGTEAGLFETAGIPTVICGPGDIDQAHKPDEFIALEQIGLCEQFLRRMVERLEARAA